ncbi:MAG: ester cyclase [Myxococcota bacterium]
MNKLYELKRRAIWLGAIALSACACAQTSTTQVRAAKPRVSPKGSPLSDSAFAPPKKSQDQLMDNRNSVPKDFETHIIVTDEAGRARAEKIIKLYEVFAKNPSEKTLREFLSDRYIQHSSMVPNGRGPIAALFASSAVQYDVAIDIHKIIVVGDWAMAHVNFRNINNAEPDDLGMAAVDMYFFGPDGRVEEHWDVLQQVPAFAPNNNGMFVKLYQGN